MAFGITNHFKGGTKEQYDRTVAVVHPDGLPEGQTHHFAGATEDGWQVVAIWDSAESWNRFRDDKLVPALQSMDDGLPGPPVGTSFEVHREQHG